MKFMSPNKDVYSLMPPSLALYKPFIFRGTHRKFKSKNNRKKVGTFKYPICIMDGGVPHSCWSHLCNPLHRLNFDLSLYRNSGSKNSTTLEAWKPIIHVNVTTSYPVTYYCSSYVQETKLQLWRTWVRLRSVGPILF